MFFVGNDRLEKLGSEAKQNDVRSIAPVLPQKIKIGLARKKRHFIKETASVKLRQVHQVFLRENSPES